MSDISDLVNIVARLEGHDKDIKYISDELSDIKKTLRAGLGEIRDKITRSSTLNWSAIVATAALSIVLIGTVLSYGVSRPLKMQIGYERQISNLKNENLKNQIAYVNSEDDRVAKTIAKIVRSIETNTLQKNNTYQ